jgi:hypothetical protein
MVPVPGFLALLSPVDHPVKLYRRPIRGSYLAKTIFSHLQVYILAKKNAIQIRLSCE